MDRVQALTAFWKSFNIPAYDVNTVPDNAVTPYLTFEIITDSFGNEVGITNSLWTRSTSWAEITQKSEELYNYIGNGGVMVPYDNGAVWIKRATPFSQRLIDDDYKRIVMNFSMEFITSI